MQRRGLVMIQMLLADASQEDLEQHYHEAIETRKQFDKVRPNFYQNFKGWNHNPMMAHYRTWLKDQDAKYIFLTTKKDKSSDSIK